MHLHHLWTNNSHGFGTTVFLDGYKRLYCCVPNIVNAMDINCLCCCACKVWDGCERVQQWNSLYEQWSVYQQQQQLHLWLYRYWICGRHMWNQRKYNTLKLPKLACSNIWLLQTKFISICSFFYSTWSITVKPLSTETHTGPSNSYSL